MHPALLFGSGASFDTVCCFLGTNGLLYALMVSITTTASQFLDRGCAVGLASSAPSYEVDRAAGN